MPFASSMHVPLKSRVHEAFLIALTCVLRGEIHVGDVALGQCFRAQMFVTIVEG
jgi:hypothetical protein